MTICYLNLEVYFLLASLIIQLKEAKKSVASFRKRRCDCEETDYFLRFFVAFFFFVVFLAFFFFVAIEKGGKKYFQSLYDKIFSNERISHGVNEGIVM